MMKRNKTRLLLLALLLGLLAVCGTAVAYMYTQSETKQNQFSIAEVACRVEEVVRADEKTSIKVQNTGNIDAYIRVRLVSYWVQDDGNGNVKIIGKPSKIPRITLAEGWLKEENNTYYYTSPVAHDGFTGELLSAPLPLEVHEDGYLQVIEVFAEAIQSKPVEAVTDSWKVTVTGETITSVP